MEKEKYSIPYFILNESFQRYVIDEDPKEASAWETFILENPEAFQCFNDAKEIIFYINKRGKIPVDSNLSKEVFGSLQERIEREKERERNTGIKPKWYWYAASILVIVGIAAMLRFISFAETDYSGNALQVFVPKGQRSKVILPDGTHVWLNSGTVLKYPSNFGSGSRNVFVSGEAFFKVKHRRGNPFYVNLRNNLAIKVTGTEFNVKSYPEEKRIETTLLKGSVHLIQFSAKQKVIQQVDLIPNHKAIYSDNSKTIEVRQIEDFRPHAAPQAASKTNVPDIIGKNTEIELITSWKEDVLMFHNETFEEIAVRMERWYGLKITILDEELKQERFTGKFVNNESIYQLLDIINRSEPIRYTTEGKEILINKKQK